MIETSPVVRARDFREQWFLDRAAELHEPVNMHRKLWEFCAIAQVYHERIATGGAVLGFGVGLEPLAAWFARSAHAVLASDRPDETAEWAGTAQHAANLEALRRPAICDDRRFQERVRFLPVDMNAIPDSLCRGSYDLTWSSGSFEHLGSFEHSLTFFLRQMACLKPGGLAVHTTEYNPRNSGPTLEARDLVLFRAAELHELEQRLAAQGDTLWPLDLVPGTEAADLKIDQPPYGFPHLKLMVGGTFLTTSVMLVAQRGGMA